MDDQKDDRQHIPPATDETGGKLYVPPTLTIYGNLQQITATVGVSGAKDGGSGMKNVRSQP